jgi:hypothetical protein
MRIAHLVVAASATLLLAACGGSDGGDAGDAGPLDGKTGTEVAAAAADALEAAGAVHVEGTIKQDGEASDIDLQLQGEDVAGTITVGGIDLELIAVDGAQFARTTAGFWASSGVPADVAASLDGQWVVLPSGTSDFGDLSLAGIVDSLRNPESAVADDVTADQFDGRDVVVVTQDDGSTLLVADEDPSYPLQLTNEGDSSGSVAFTGFGEEEDISAPEGAVDLQTLAGS